MTAERWITDLPISDRYPFYTRANAGEVLPDPACPLGWNIVWDATREGWRDAFLAGGTCEPDEVSVEEVVGSFGGYLYINASLSRIFGVRGPGLTPEMIDLTYYGDHPDVPPYVAESWHESEANTAKMAVWMQEVLTSDLSELLDDQRLANESRANRPNLRDLDDHALVERARSFRPAIRKLFERHILVTAGASIGPGILNAIAEAVGDPSLGLKLITGVGDVDSALPSRALWALSRLDEGSAEFAEGFEAFLVEFGSRGPNEWDIISDVWETKPELAANLIAVMRKQDDSGDPAMRANAVSAEREAITAHIREAIAGDPEASAQFEAGLASAHRHLAGRERAKTNIIKVINEVRVCFRELARRHGIDVVEFHQLLDEELEAFLGAPDGFRARLSQRAVEYRELFELDPPFIIVDEVPPLSAWPRRSEAQPQVASSTGDVLTGVPGCSGVVTGTARVILDPSDPLALEPGEVLVAPHTDPAWTPLFVPAAAVVVNVGAQVSHAIIVSRELGIPCVVSVQGATDKIVDGSTVTVDGAAGTVTVH